MATITEAFIKNECEPRGTSAVFFRDTGKNAIRHFAVRVTPNGVKAFVMSWTSGNKTQSHTIGRCDEMTVLRARDIATQLVAVIAEGRHPGREEKARQEQERREEAQSIKFGELTRRFLDEYVHEHRAKSTHKATERHIRSCVSLFGKKACEITSNELTAIHVAIPKRDKRQHASEGGKVEANRTIQTVRDIYSWALARNKIGKGRTPLFTMDQNPAEGVRLYAETKNERYLSHDEYRRLSAALEREPDWRWKAYFPILGFLGNRANEILKSRWTQVKFDQGVWEFPRHKTSKKTGGGFNQPIPPDSAVYSILWNLPSRGRNQFVFPGGRKANKDAPVREYGKAWARLIKDAGLKGVPGQRDPSPNCLRHTHATWLANDHNTDLAVIGKGLNHSNITTTTRYATMQLRSVSRANRQLEQQMLATGARALIEARAKVPDGTSGVPWDDFV